MPVTSVEKDLDALTMTIVADFPVPVRRLWDAYVDPRQIERFWGPPTWPATFTRHDVSPGGRSSYHMTGPAGETSHGYWEFVAVDPGRSFEVLDGFAGPDGEPDPTLPSMRMVFTFTATDDGSRLVTVTSFPSLEALEQLLTMGMEEGTRSAMTQIDAVLADLVSFAADRGTGHRVLDDTRVRISRVVRGPLDLVWRAHREPDLVRRWMLGPDGWTMPVCEVAASVGDTFRYEWEREGGGERFGFTGELLELDPPHREVSTERMLGTDGPSNRNEMTLTEVDGGTLITLLITYPDATTRDTILGTGMLDGMEIGYARLEADVLSPA